MGTHVCLHMRCVVHRHPDTHSRPTPKSKPLHPQQVKDIKPLMKENLVRLLQTDDSRVNIKARTHENVDSVGESRSWVVHVVILLEKI